MVGKAKHLAVGIAGEETAARYIESLGWTALARNWRPRGAMHGLELDIVARDGDCLVFVEVKTRMVRAGDLEAGPGIPVHAAFSPAKQRRMAHAAMLFLSSRNLWDLACRFDLICVKQTPQGESLLEHHDNVIQLGNLMDRGNAAWQPW